MKISKIAIGTSAFVLAIGGFYATKANKKFNTPMNGSAVILGAQVAALNSFTGSFNTVPTGKHVAVIAVTAGSGSYVQIATLQTSAGTGKKKIYR